MPFEIMDQRGSAASSHFLYYISYKRNQVIKRKYRKRLATYSLTFLFKSYIVAKHLIWLAQNMTTHYFQFILLYCCALYFKHQHLMFGFPYIVFCALYFFSLIVTKLKDCNNTRCYEQ